MKQSELILNPDGSIYHLGLHPEDIASKVILVGDQDRVDQIGTHFDEIDQLHQKREFRSLTGWYQKQRITVLSTGIGADNVDIVWHELDALVNLDLNTGTPLPNPTALKALRLGTCGGLQARLSPGSLVFSRYSVGADGLMHYYQQPSFRGKMARFARQLTQFQNSAKLSLPLYPAKSDDELTELLARNFPQISQGITFTASGFYGPQGRSLGRLPITYENLPHQMSLFRLPEESLEVLNMEMESSAVLGLGTALGHRTGTICTVLANRVKGTFAEHPKAEVETLIQTGLEVLLAWE
ncbi:MAG: nucleoside phosphorylase [Bacteroidota bacterium]